MALSDHLSALLEHAIEAYAYRDFQKANEIFGTISTLYPGNFTARYFHAMTLCATGDFSDARHQLNLISMESEEPVWQKVAENGMNLINRKEDSIRRALELSYEF
jgi:hypothetical protein